MTESLQVDLFNAYCVLIKDARNGKTLHHLISELRYLPGLDKFRINALRKKIDERFSQLNLEAMPTQPFPNGRWSTATLDISPL